jgi:hypothetical protein
MDSSDRGNHSDGASELQAVWRSRDASSHTSHRLLRLTSQSLPGKYYESASITLCGLVVRLPGSRTRGPGFDSPDLLDFLNSSGSVNGVNPALVRINEELLERKVAAPF